MSAVVISVQYLCHYLPFFKRIYNQQRLLSVSEHQGGAGVGAGRHEQHQEGQVYAAGQSG